MKKICIPVILFIFSSPYAKALSVTSVGVGCSIQNQGWILKFDNNIPHAITEKILQTEGDIYPVSIQETVFNENIKCSYGYVAMAQIDNVETELSPMGGKFIAETIPLAQGLHY
jgi:hypothetical protein